MKADAADEYADFFGVRSEADVRAAVLQAQQVCEESYLFYDKAIQHVEAHPSIRAYRTFETSFFGIFKFGTENRALLLVIMVVFAAISTTLKPIILAYAVQVPEWTLKSIRWPCWLLMLFWHSHLIANTSLC